VTTVLVTGATGTLGRAAVPALVAAGHDVRAMSRTHRRPGGAETWVRADLATGQGLAVAVDGVGTVVHLASAPYRRGYTHQVDVAGTARLVAAARAAGVDHVLLMSIVGVDRVPWGFFRTKLEAEREVARGGTPWTVLRATQFFDLLDAALAALTRLPVVPLDRGIRAQPVDTADVADLLVELVAAGPARDTVELGGPEVLTGDTALREWMAATGRRRRILPVRGPGRMLAAFRDGAATTPALPAGTRTWSDFLARRYGHRPSRA
jgi:uncharacterized protein YbjT (DUF2867 family)